MAYLDFKVTLWHRIEIPDDQIDEAKEMIESGTLQTMDDAIIELQIDDPHVSTIDGTEEQISPAENYGQSTIELIGKNEVKVTDNTI